MSRKKEGKLGTAEVSKTVELIRVLKSTNVDVHRRGGLQNNINLRYFMGKQERVTLSVLGSETSKATSWLPSLTARYVRSVSVSLTRGCSKRSKG